MQSSSNQADLLQPLFLFSEQLKQKSIKKSAIESLQTIAIALGQQKTRKQFIPFIAKQFIKQNTQIRVLFLKFIPNLLQYLGPKHYALLLLEMVFDILCAFSQPEIRNEGFACLQKIINYIDIKKQQSIIVDTLVLLDKQKEIEIKQLIIKTIPQIFVQVDQKRQQILIKIVKRYLQVPETQLLLAKQLKNFIKIIPPTSQQQIKLIMETLSSSEDEKIKINLIDAIILLTKTLGESATKGYFEKITNNAKTSLLCQLFKKFKQLAEVFSKQSLSSLKDCIINFQTQNQDVKNAILEGIENLQLNDQQKRVLLVPHSSLQLKYTLGEKLCQLKDFQALGKLLQNSDTQFKTKIFPKLPSISVIHVQILQTFLAAKNWRLKINILLNIEKRVENDEQAEILLPTLSKYLGDKIGAVRLSIITIMVKIIQKKNMVFNKYCNLLQQALNTQNWFGRQSVYILLLKIVNNSQKLDRDHQNIMLFCKKGLKQEISNIRSVVVDTLSQIRQKGNSKIQQQATILLNGTPRIFY